MKNKRVIVGLSGGVDSAVAAHLLKTAGYAVIGAFIRTWHPPFLPCTEETDRLDAMRVAAHLQIPFITIDARLEYERDVARVMIEEYKKGHTPNPDMLCNRAVKFEVLSQALKRYHASLCATGHYARIVHCDGSYSVLTGVDRSKDQSYFLADLPRELLPQVVFPLGTMTKSMVRAYAKRVGLPNAERKDSQGICFLGTVDMRDFLSHYIEMKPGIVHNTSGEVVGTHQGAFFYTRGERHGFTIHTNHHSAVPLYVQSTNIHTNTITVSESHPTLTHNNTIHLSQMNVLADTLEDGQYDAVLRYHQTPVPVRYANVSGTHTITLLRTTEHPPTGQTCALYRGERLIAGGIIETP